MSIMSNIHSRWIISKILLLSTSIVTWEEWRTYGKKQAKFNLWKNLTILLKIQNILMGKYNLWALPQLLQSVCKKLSISFLKLDFHKKSGKVLDLSDSSLDPNLIRKNKTLHTYRSMGNLSKLITLIKLS